MKIRAAPDDTYASYAIARIASSRAPGTVESENTSEDLGVWVVSHKASLSSCSRPGSVAKRRTLSARWWLTTWRYHVAFVSP